MTTRIYKPMKVLMRKHACALRFVHHMGKGGADDTRRGGQKMLGGTANHAWSEDSLYISRLEKKKGSVRVEFESKSAPEQTYTISGLDNKGWTPYFEPEPKKQDSTPTTPGRRSRQSKGEADPIIDLMSQGGAWKPADLAKESGIKYHTVYRRLRNMEAAGTVKASAAGYTLS
jgi:hypothetical protein